MSVLAQVPARICTRRTGGGVRASRRSRTIGGLDRPDSGHVVVDGINLATAKDKQLSAYRNRHVGFVFQSFNLQVHETALENVISPLVIGGVGRKKERPRPFGCTRSTTVSWTAEMGGG